MRFSLICDKNIRMSIVEKFDLLGIQFYQDADIHIVQHGMESDYIPCIVFHLNEIDQLLSLIKKMTNIGATNETPRLIGTINEAIHMIDYHKILYIESLNGKVLCHDHQEIYVIKATLQQLLEQLPIESFIRVGKSFIVNIDNVDRIIPWFNRRLLLKFENSAKEVEVSKNYVRAFKTFLGIR